MTTALWILVAFAALAAVEGSRRRASIRPRRFATAQGPRKPNPPPNLHGHTVRGVSGDLFAAMCLELLDSQRDAAARDAFVAAGAVPMTGGFPKHGRDYLLVGANVAVYPRTDPTPPTPPAWWRRWSRGRWALAVLAFFVLAPWLAVLAVYVRAFYGLYAQGVIRFFLP